MAEVMTVVEEQTVKKMVRIDYNRIDDIVNIQQMFWKKTNPNQIYKDTNDFGQKKRNNNNALKHTN